MTCPAPASRTARPRRRSRQVLALSVFVATLSLLTGCLKAGQSQVLTEMNADRTANRLSALRTQADAQKKAQAWAEKLARENTLYHSNLPDGIHVRWCSLGENVGYGPDVPTIEDAYMKSPGHRANILNTKWNGAGVGVATNGKRVFTVQVFIKTC